MKKLHRPVALGTALAFTPCAFATNGMNLEGYGPVSTAMGGTSMAFDNGTAAVMNNPATLAMGRDGNRIDVAIGELKPNVSAEMDAMNVDWDSGGDSYLMPAFGWVRDRGQLSYGVGVFAQGGMGTEYSNGGPGTTFAALGNSVPGMEMGFTGGAFGGSLSAATAAEIGDLEERSEVGVARVIFPLAYEVNDKLNVGASLDWVRATMDVKMFMPGASFANLVNDNRVSGDMLNSLNGLFMGGNISEVWGAYLDSSDSSDFNGAAVGTGFAGKLGVTYRVNPKLTVGATYHSKTALSDLEDGGTMTMYVEDANLGMGNPAGTDLGIPLSGDVTVHDFEWPETYAVGVAFQANERLLLSADVKRINWADVMKDFSVTFKASGAASNDGFAGQSISFSMPQNWDDQTVIQLGAAYRVTDALTVRGGYNQASNPVPDDTVNYLFPAIVERHFTAGVGYAVTEASTVDFSATYAPEVTVTGDGADNAGLDISHSQTNWQLMYSYRF